MASHQGIVVRVLSWNLFHGRDDPAPGQIDYRRSLHSQFAAQLARLDWDVALLQETPPRWAGELAFRAGAQGYVVKTSRNQLGWLRGRIGERRPDLIKSNEGGSNVVLARPPWNLVEERRLTLARWPERRRMQWLRLAQSLGASFCVANLHASAHDSARAAKELARAARAAVDWSGELPLVLGGDTNVRPSEEPWVFDQLERDGFSGPTASGAIDHLLVRGMTVLEAPRQLPPASREVEAGGLPRVRLSDHAIVVATFDLG